MKLFKKEIWKKSEGIKDLENNILFNKNIFR